MRRLFLLPLLLLLPARPAALSAQGSAADADARAATEDYARTGRARVVQGGTHAMVPFGHVQPTLRCAPLRVCTVELQAGERVVDHALGDPERWAVDFAAGPDSTPLVVAKPVALPDACQLTTNLMVSTTRRIYHLTLDSPPCGDRAGSTNPDLPYTRHVKFYYPDEALVRRQAPAAGPAPPAPGTGGLEEPGRAMAAADLGELHFDYRTMPDRGFPWRPAAVFDNGRETCIRLPREAYHGDLAVLYEMDARGGYKLVQYAVRDGCILAGRVMQRMVLLVPAGEGRAPLRLLVVRRRPEEDR